MSRQCENCGQSVLDSDTSCWHCGWQLTPEKEPSSGQSSADTKADQVTFSWRVLLGYAGLTALIFFALFLVMLRLGKRPLNLVAPPEADWRTVSDRRRSFAVDLPPDWNWLDQGDRGASQVFQERLAQEPHLLAAATPFGDLVTELRPLSIATDESGDQGNTGFMLVVQDARASPLSAEQAMARLRLNNDNVTLLENSRTDDSDDQSGIEFAVDIPDQEADYHCLQSFYGGEQASYLMIICSENRHFASYLKEFRLIVASFRFLPG